jgi:hypothetical protein
VSEKDKPSTSGTILPPIHNQNMPWPSITALT